MSDGCSTAKEWDGAAKAMTMIKRLTILIMFRRTEFDRNRMSILEYHKWSGTAGTRPIMKHVAFVFEVRSGCAP
jgi:hypothetical protein